MEGGLRIPRAYVAVPAALALLAAGCGGKSDDDADEPPYTVEIVRAAFPQHQRLAQQSTLEIAVRNSGDETIPNLAVTVHGLAERTADIPELSLWIIDAAPRGAVTASADTWTVGRVKPGATRTLRWRVTAIQPGRKTLSYEVAGNLKGHVRTERPGGGAPRGSVAVRVTAKAPQARVDPRTGQPTRDAARSGAGYRPPGTP